MSRLIPKVTICHPITSGFIGGLSFAGCKVCIDIVPSTVEQLDVRGIYVETGRVLKDFGLLDEEHVFSVGLNPPPVFLSQDLLRTLRQPDFTRLFNSLRNALSLYGKVVGLRLRASEVTLHFEPRSLLSRQLKRFIDLKSEIDEERIGDE